MNLRNILFIVLLCIATGMMVNAEDLVNTLPEDSGLQVVEGHDDQSAVSYYQESYKVSGEYYDTLGKAVTAESLLSTVQIINNDQDDPSLLFGTKLKKKGSVDLDRESRVQEKEMNKAVSAVEAVTKWAGDILVSSHRVGSGQDMDQDEVTGYLYAVFDKNYSTNDRAYVYRSTNGGTSWSLWSTMANIDGSLSNVRIRVARDGGGQTWVCPMAIWNEPDGSKKLYMKKINASTSSSTWKLVTSYNVDYADLDGDVGTGAYLYCTYVRSSSGNDVYATRFNLGNSWTNNTLLFVNPGVNPEPAIAAGAGGQVSVVFLDTRLSINEEIRIKRSTNYGASWAGSVQVSNNSGAANLKDIDIAYTHTPMQTGWIFATFVFGGDQNLAYYRSTTSGSSWTYSGVIGASGSNLKDNNVSLRTKKTVSALTVAYNHDPGNDVMFTWTMASNPTNFTTPMAVNDHDGTGIWPPTAGWTTNSGNYSCVLYSSFTEDYKLYFDYFGN